jgi:fucose 4-O-acetylase-like acetyltransferase
MSGGSEIGEQAAAARSGTPEPRARLDWVDALKGIGILAVIVGHVWSRGPVRDVIYTVHMPLFFILSGYTARFVPWRSFGPALLRGLGLPFLCFSILLLGADFLIEHLRGVRPIFPGWWQGAKTILLATEKTRGPFAILWFIPCLFLARIVWNALLGDGRRADSRLILTAMLAVFALALWAQYRGSWSPFALLAVPGALLMIWAGALWRLRALPRVAIWGLAGLALATLIWFPPLNMKQGDLGWPGVSLAGAVAVTMSLAMLVQRLPVWMIGAFAALGRASLVIMYVHIAFIHYLAPYGPNPVLFLAALGGSWGLDRLIRRWGTTRLLLLGAAKTPH